MERSIPSRRDFGLGAHQAFLAFTGKDWDPAKYRLDFCDLLNPEGESGVCHRSRCLLLSNETCLVCIDSLSECNGLSLDVSLTSLASHPPLRCEIKQVCAAAEEPRLSFTDGS